MSSSATARIHYGLILDDDAPEWDDDWEAFYASAKGETEPSEEYGDGSDERIKALYYAHWSRKREMVEAEPCAVEWHGYLDSDGQRCVLVKASEQSAYASEPTSIDALAIGPSWDLQLRAFCDVMGIPWTEPRWWLSAKYG